MNQTAFEVNMLAAEGFRRLTSVERQLQLRAEAVRQLIAKALEQDTSLTSQELDALADEAFTGAHQIGKELKEGPPLKQDE